MRAGPVSFEASARGWARAWARRWAAARLAALLMLMPCLAWAERTDACLFETCWGAVGLTPEYSGVWTFGHGTREAVIDRARRTCGGPCLTLRVFQNACGAIALKEQGDLKTVWSWSIEQSRFDAESAALDRCREDGAPGTCRVVSWACSFPYP